LFDEKKINRNPTCHPPPSPHAFTHTHAKLILMIILHICPGQWGLGP